MSCSLVMGQRVELGLSAIFHFFLEIELQYRRNLLLRKEYDVANDSYDPVCAQSSSIRIVCELHGF